MPDLQIPDLVVSWRDGSTHPKIEKTTRRFVQMQRPNPNFSLPLVPGLGGITKDDLILT